ncbi:MAG: hypothetical protein FJX47_08535 [Alphaproteobacteria bacterium]|nr:hypothetical protein [Alphaproteobacteria bacterium]
MTDLRWTASLVEERMVEAADTLKRLPEERIQDYFSTWPSVIRDYWEAFGREDVRLRRGPPSAAAIDRMDEALAWLAWLDPAEARIVWLRASGERWKTVCWKVGLARTAAHQHWMYALCVISWRLNGRRLPHNLSRRRVIEETQAASQ